MTADGTSPRRPGGVRRAVLVYTGLRLLLFLAVFLVVQVFLAETLLALGVAVLVSALVSIPLLKPYRHELNEATRVRAEQRAQAQRERRSRLDES